MIRFWLHAFFFQSVCIVGTLLMLKPAKFGRKKCVPDIFLVFAWLEQLSTDSEDIVWGCICLACRKIQIMPDFVTDNVHTNTARDASFTQAE